MKPKPNDEDLVKRCQAELPFHTGAYEQLVERYKDKVYLKVRQMLKNQEEARDVTQDIFIKMFTGIQKFRFEASFSTWLYSITVNTCLNHIEKLQRRPWWWLTTEIDEHRNSEKIEAEIFALVSSGAQDNELQDLIGRTMQSLPVSSKKILTLRYYDELDYRSIAENLGINLSAAKMRLKRAREEFKSVFSKLSKGDDYAQ